MNKVEAIESFELVADQARFAADPRDFIRALALAMAEYARGEVVPAPAPTEATAA